MKADKDFGDILEAWERLSAKPGGLDAAEAEEEAARSSERKRRLEAEAAQKAAERLEQARRRSFTAMLDEYGFVDKDAELDAAPSPEAERDRLARLVPQDRLDLHGMKAEEAEAALGAFIERSARRGLEKVLVVTGKGHHSKDGPVLGTVARSFLESSHLAGRFHHAPSSLGGAGALVVYIRRGIISRGR